MKAPEQDRKPAGATHLPGGPGGPEAWTGAKRAWSAPTVTTFKVTDTRGADGGITDGLNNGTNVP